MTPRLLLGLVVEPCLGWLDQMGIASDERARVMLLAIAGQECGYRHRCQVITGGARGPARGLWQFELGGGVHGVLRHAATKDAAAQACADLLVPPTKQAVHTAIEHNDMLACVFARLLLWSDPAPMPESAATGWSCYLRTWRPGKPHQATWQKHWNAACEAVKGGHD